MQAASTLVRAELYRRAPDVFRDQLQAWVERGVEPADNLLYAIISNDLGTVFAHAAEDTWVFSATRKTLRWLWEHAPSECYGSRGHVETWHSHRGEACRETVP